MSDIIKTLNRYEDENESLRTLIMLLVFVIVVLAGFLLEIELKKPISCTPDYCVDNFCITLKGDK